MKKQLRIGLDVVLVLLLAMALIAYTADSSQDKGDTGSTFAADRADRADELDDIEEELEDADGTRAEDDDSEESDSEGEDDSDSDSGSGGGSITLEYGGLDSDSGGLSVSAKAMIKDLGLFEKAVESVENRYRLDRDIGVIIGDLPENNEVFVANGPAYYPNVDAIVFPWNFMRTTYDVLEEEAASSDEAMKFTAQSLQYVLYHEFAHVLIDQLDLAVTGREEDAADQFATLLAMETGGPLGAYATGIVFTELEGDSPPSMEAYMDEHSFGKQRMVSSLCYIYGAAEVSGEGGSEEISNYIGDRAPRCASEFEQMASSWTRILEPHRIDSADQESE